MNDATRASLARIAAALLCGALACDTTKTEETKAASVAPAKGSTSAPAKAEPAKAEPAKAPAAEAPAAAAPVEMTEFDLTPADPTWAGWTAKGPASAKVMADGVKGARIAAGRRDGGFDIAFAPKQTDLAELKKNLEIGAKASDGKLEHTFTADATDKLEWTSTGYGATKYNFVMHMKVGDREVTCKNNYMVGIDSAEARTQHQEACKTLAKK
jgi:hypothetical protein